MKMRIITLLSLMSLSIIACEPSKKQAFTTTASGIEYQIVKKTDGAAPASGQMVTFSWKGMYSDKKVFHKPVKNETTSFVLGSTFASAGMVEALQLLKVGEKGIFKMKKSLAFTSSDKYSHAPADSLIIFEIELKKVSACPALKAPLEVKHLKDTLKGPGGLLVIIAGKGKGQKVEKGGSVFIHYSGYLTDMTPFDASVTRNMPFKTAIGKGMVIQGWDEGISLLHVGDTARLIIPASMGYGARSTGKIPANSTLIFDVTVLDYKAPIKATPFVFDAKNIQKTASGLQYVVIEKGSGEAPKKGGMVKVHYTGYLEDGSVFDSSVERDEPFTFNVGIGRVIQGWDEGIMMMNSGAKYRFIIPSDLAYGDQGYPPVIPQKATLIFDVEMLKAN